MTAHVSCMVRSARLRARVSVFLRACVRAVRRSCCLRRFVLNHDTRRKLAVEVYAPSRFDDELAARLRAEHVHRFVRLFIRSFVRPTVPYLLCRSLLLFTDPHWCSRLT